MKKRTLTLFLLVFILSCKDEELPVVEFTQKDIIGKWYPYQIKYLNDGNVVNGPFTGNGIFAPYQESVWINENFQFYPANYIDGKLNIALFEGTSVIPSGTVEFSPSEKKISFHYLIKSLGNDFDFYITRYDVKTLWVEADFGRGRNSEYRFKRFE